MIDARARFLAFCVPLLDEALSPARFKRRGVKSGKYFRVLNEARQVLEIAIHVRPRYEPEAQLHVYPMVEAQMPSVNQIALEMVRDKALLGNALEVTIRQPLEMTAPAAKQRRWFVGGEDTYSDVSASIVESVKNWGVPFFDDYRGPADLVRGYERSDPRLLVQQHFVVYVAAAYLLLGRTHDAESVLKNRLGSQGLQKRYARAFEYVHGKATS
ncbi:MAG: hypothetical protein ABI584_02650 [Acidobacteriota bacterium]